jgi:hypothetical protein
MVKMNATNLRCSGKFDSCKISKRWSFKITKQKACNIMLAAQLRSRTSMATSCTSPMLGILVGFSAVEVCRSSKEQYHTFTGSFSYHVMNSHFVVHHSCFVELDLSERSFGA